MEINILGVGPSECSKRNVSWCFLGRSKWCFNLAYRNSLLFFNPKQLENKPLHKGNKYSTALH